MGDFTERDLWYEARQRTADEGKSIKSILTNSLFKASLVSIPGLPTRAFFSLDAKAADEAVFVPDFNKYRERDLKPYIDAGCRAFMFRMGGPSRWVEGNWGYERDKTFWPYMEQADKYGVLDQTIGYIVHNPFESWSINGSTGETMHTEMIDEWTAGGYLPAALMYDHEIDKCWRATGAEVYCTAPNLVTSLAENTLNTWNKYHRMVSAYTANWFLKQKDYWNLHVTHFTNINKPETEGGPGTQRPLHLAWYGKELAGPYATVEEMEAGMLKLTPDYLSKYLWCGYRADLWQFTSAGRIGADKIGVDMNMSLAAHASTFFKTYGLKEPGAVVPPVEPPIEPPVAEDKILARLVSLESGAISLTSRVAALEQHTHTATTTIK
jgi:hypothetical protein